MEIKNKRQLAILGSTGSIGTQTLKVVEEHPECFEVYAITANSRVEELIAQARKFMPEAVVIADETKYQRLKEALDDLPIKVYGGYESICQIVESKPIDIVVTAMVGFSGLRPTINAIKAGKAIALANKETMVVAGELINALANEYKTPILPVDSEHSAIFQCLKSGRQQEIKRILLTASGGPFFGYTSEQLKNITLEEADGWAEFLGLDEDYEAFHKKIIKFHTFLIDRFFTFCYTELIPRGGLFLIKIS